MFRVTVVAAGADEFPCLRRLQQVEVFGIKDIAIVGCKYGYQNDNGGNDGIAVHFLEAYHRDLPLKFTVERGERAGHRMHRVDESSQICRVVLLDMVEQARQYGGIQRTAEAGAVETDDTHGFKIEVEGDTSRKGIGQRGVHDADSGTFEHQRQVEHIFLGRCVDKVVEHYLIEQEREKSGEHNRLDSPFVFHSQIEEVGAGGNSDDNAPVEVGIVARIVVQDSVREYVLCVGGSGRHQCHASEQQEDVEHIVLSESSQADIGMAYGGGSVEAEREQNDGEHDGCPYFFAVEPVVILAIHADEHDANQP